MKFVFSSLFLMLFTFSGNGETPAIDSLTRLVSTLQGEERIVLLNKIAFQYHRIDPKKTLSIAEETMLEAEKMGFHLGRINALNNYGIGQVFLDRTYEALRTFEKVAEEADIYGLQESMHRALNNQANLFVEMGQLEKAMASYQKAVIIAKLVGDYKAYCIYQNNLAAKQLEVDELDKAFRSLNAILPIAEKLENKSVLVDVQTTFGVYYEQKGQVKDAISIYNAAIRNCDLSGDKQGMIQVMNQLGNLYADQNKLDLALEYNREALKLAEDFGSSRIKTECLLAISETFLRTKNYIKAISFADMGLRHAGNSKNIAITPSFYEILYQSFRQRGEFYDALFFHERFKQVSDSLNISEQEKQIAKVQMEYDFKNHEEENIRLKEAQVIQEVSLKQRSYISGLVGLGLILMTFIAVLLFRNNKRKFKFNQELQLEVDERTKDLASSNRDLKRSNIELERFAHIASHDLKEPLRNITSFVRLIERRLVGKDEGLKEYLQFVQNNAKQMHLLIEDVLEFSRQGHSPTVIETVDANKVVSQVKLALKEVIEKSKAVVECEKLPELYSNSSQLYLLFKNIIENGIRFNKSEIRNVKIACKKVDGYYQFSFKDNGMGIDESYHEKIFGMFERLQDRQHYRGSGLGLSLCKKIVDRLNGKIWVDSTLGEGSNFYISLPVKMVNGVNGEVNMKFKSISQSEAANESTDDVQPVSETISR